MDLGISRSFDISNTDFINTPTNAIAGKKAIDYFSKSSKNNIIRQIISIETNIAPTIFFTFLKKNKVMAPKKASIHIVAIVVVIPPSKVIKA